MQELPLPSQEQYYSLDADPENQTNQITSTEIVVIQSHQTQPSKADEP